MSRRRHESWWGFGAMVLVLVLCTLGAAPRPIAAQDRQAVTHAHQASAALQSEAGLHAARHERSADRAHGDFPPLPPDPYDSEKMPVPSLESELWNHGGSYLYSPEGDRLNWPDEQSDAHYDLLRLPEEWIEPQPWTLYSDFLGADAINTGPYLKWFGPGGFMWDRRFVGYGGISLFALALEQNQQRQDVIGQQLVLDLDLRLTGTERFHVQFRPLGRDNSGGSFYQFSAPQGYVDNSTGEPQRYWFEGELASMFGSYVDSFAPLDLNVAAGRFPFALHNSLLINDEFVGVALAKNNLYAGSLSNLTIQAFGGFSDVGSVDGTEGNLFGVNAFADHRLAFYELSYALLEDKLDSRRDSHFAAFSRTKFYGPWSLAGRAMFRWSGQPGGGSGQLFVLESNRGWVFDDRPWGIEQAIAYCNAFLATSGWSSISGGNFNRLRSSFETNPVVRIAAGIAPDELGGVALGVQLLRRHADESFVPEIAFESSQGEPALGLGLRYQRKTSSRSYFEALLSFALSDDPRLDREGAFLSYNLLF